MMAEALEHEAWRGSIQGNSWMHRSLIRLFRIVNLRLVYLVMGVFVIPFYMLFAHQGYISMYHYFRRRHGYGPLKAFRYVYLNHYRFGQVILDRFAAYAGRRFQISCDGYDLLQQLSRSPEGFIILSAHVGNYELAGYTFKAEKRYNALVFSGEAPTVMENRNRLLKKNNIRMIPVSEDMSHIYLLNDALAAGEIVSIPADRIFGSPRFVECQLLGATARLPLGPFAMALQRGVPTITVLVMKDAAYRYTAYIRRVTIDDGRRQALMAASGGRLTRQQEATLLAQAYADELETVLKRYPEQWYNYYELWN